MKKKKKKKNRSGSGSGGTVAKDALGNDVIASEWIKIHGPGDRTLTQGLKVGLHLCSWFNISVNLYCLFK